MGKYLITGGTGFIGSHLAESLLREGNEVVVIGIPAKDYFLSKKIKIYGTTINNSNIARIFADEKPEIIYHLAGPINLRRPVDDPLFDLSINFFSDAEKLLNCSQEAGVKKFIFTSSGGALYGSEAPIPTSEKIKVCPDSLYGMANFMLEKLIESHEKRFGLPCSILRLSNVYGPRQWEEGIIPSIIKSIITGKSIAINGDGEQTRDFVYIDDVVDALGRAAEHGINEIMNVGSGRETSLNSLCREISNILGEKTKINYQKNKDFGPNRSAVDISNAKEKLGWEPTTPLNRGLEKTIGWLREK